MKEYPKRIKRLLREWMTEAYERELHRELKKLEKDFESWRSGEICNGEMSSRIHEYEIGPSQALFKHCNYSPNDITVAYAIVSGILNEEDVPAEMVEAIRVDINYCRSLKEENNLASREGRWWETR